ncbi:hypothetical protein TWF506_003154 [Arthrobotrys conoides]|uniref:F-box domain-containing protein n=1 Tax=Arthrobotrys conoides TaxID=74498 RepID=A0AAN8RUF4_9PEZI
MSAFARTPPEIWLEVFKLLGPYGVFGIRRVSKQFYNNSFLLPRLYCFQPEIWINIFEYLDYVSLKAIFYATKAFERLLTYKRTPLLTTLLFLEKPPIDWDEYVDVMNSDGEIIMHPIFKGFPLHELISYNWALDHEKRDYGRKIDPWYSNAVRENATSPPLLRLRIVCWTTDVKKVYEKPHLAHSCVVNFDVSDTGGRRILVSDILKAFSKSLCSPAFIYNDDGSMQEVSRWHENITKLRDATYYLDKFVILKPRLFGVDDQTWVELRPLFSSI